MVRALLLAASAALFAHCAVAQNFVRMEVRVIDSVTLSGEQFLIREEGSGTRASMEHVFRERDVPFRVSMEVSSNETIKQAVMAGMGISFISA